MKKYLYILSLLSFLLALLVIIIMPLDEIFAIKYLLSTALLILAFIFRIFSYQKTIWFDFVILATSLALVTIGTNLLSPTTEFLITYGEEFNKIYAGILAIFPIIQLVTALREKYIFPNKLHLKIFILTIIVSFLALGGIELYGKTIDLYKLSDAEKIYLYSYNKHTPELVDLALYEIENGSSISKKMALNFINKDKDVVRENQEVLENFVFDKDSNYDTSEPIEYRGVELEEKLKLMTEISPEKALASMKTLIASDDINHNLTIVNAVRTIVNSHPELLSEGCGVAEEIVKVENARSKARNLSWKDTNLTRLEIYLRDLPEKCTELNMPLKVIFEQEDCVVMSEKYYDYNTDLCDSTSLWVSNDNGETFKRNYTKESDERCPKVLTKEEMEERNRDFRNQCLRR